LTINPKLLELLKLLAIVCIIGAFVVTKLELTNSPKNEFAVLSFLVDYTTVYDWFGVITEALFALLATPVLFFLCNLCMCC